jgi:glycosyltransferase involved in cell wall biosynthesis
VGRLNPAKDHPTFLRVVQRLSWDWPDAVFLCVGDGPPDYTRTLHQLAESLHIQERLIWAGKCEEMPAVYSALSILVLSSSDEGFPNVVGEAMACGVPCVATRAGDAALLVGDTGYTTDIGDDAALAEAVSSLLRETQGDRWVRTRDCRRRITTRFSLEALARSTEQALTSLLPIPVDHGSPKHITLVLNHLLDGGAARVAVYLAQAWTEMGRKVTILTTDDGLTPPFYPIPKDVVHVALDLRGDSHHFLSAVTANFSRLSRLRHALRTSQPDLVVSFIDGNNILCLLATRILTPVPVIVSERTDPHGRSIGRAWEFLRNLTYPWADCLVTQSQHALSYFSPRIQSRGRVIPNPIYRPPAASDSASGRTRPLVLSLGRLQKVKGHDQLIDAFALVAQEFPDWDLCIHGEGPDRRALNDQIRAHGLEGRITLGSNIADVGSRLRDADLFVLPSRTEGFPNALAEAMAWGLPVISFACASGPSELIRQELDGILVPPGDVPALAKAMARLMSDPIERHRLGARAPEVLQRFSPSRVMELWESAVQFASHAFEKRAAS